MTGPTLNGLLADQRVRFILVGGANTVVGYVLFVAFEVLVGATIGYLGSLYASYSISIILAFALHRRYTFGITGQAGIIVEFIRFASVYVVTLLINTALLPILVEVAGLSPVLAQAIIVVFATLVSYFGHKWFSFRRTTRTQGRTLPPACSR